MYRKVQEFTEEFSKLNIPVFSYGTMHNEELRKSVRLPQVVLRARIQGETVEGAVTLVGDGWTQRRFSKLDRVRILRGCFCTRLA